MARYRLSAPAKADIVAILKTSERQHGQEARVRYRALLTAAMRRIALAPEGRSTAARDELRAGLRSHRVRHRSDRSREAPAANPAHAIFYRVVERDLVAIIRVLHERMEPIRHMGVPEH